MPHRHQPFATSVRIVKVGLVALLALLGVSPPAFGQVTILESDSLALVDLYESTNGPGWNRKNNWLDGSSHAESWEGVGSDNEDRVSALFLANNNLVGPLPASLGDLAHPNALYFSGNTITGIPEELGNLQSLKRLELDATGLTSIPEALGQLANLEALWIGYNELRNLPDLSGLGSLKSLVVAGNRLDFDDLEPLVGWVADPSVRVTYIPQDSIDTVVLRENGEVRLAARAGGTQSTCTWYRDGRLIDGATDLLYTLPDPEDRGVYWCHARNELLPNLVLFSRPVQPNEPGIVVVNSEGDAPLKADAEAGVCDTGGVVVRVGLDIEEPECTLRAAIETVNRAGGEERLRIHFDVPDVAVATIRPETPLPPIDQPVVIDGATQPIGGLVYLNGTGAGDKLFGLVIAANNSHVRGLLIEGFTRSGICIGPRDGELPGCFPNTSKHSAQGRAAGPAGEAGGLSVAVTGNTIEACTLVDNFTSIAIIEANGNRILDNILSGNEGAGLTLTGGASLNDVTANRIGVEADGFTALPNDVGIIIGGSTNTIRDNVISANRVGVWIHSFKDWAGEGNVVAGNRIGTTEDGLAPLGNGVGVLLGKTCDPEGRPDGNVEDDVVCGRSFPSIRDNTVRDNLISGNTTYGMVVSGTGNHILDNDIGTTIGGEGTIANGLAGLFLNYGNANEVLGNTISGNTTDGMLITYAKDNTIEANRIGTNRSGTSALPNGRHGVHFTGWESPLTLRGNVISGNRENGIHLQVKRKGLSNGLTIVSNRIGTDAAGLEGLGNEHYGVYLNGGRGVRVQGNVISANGDGGLLLEGEDVARTVVRDNKIGTTESGGLDAALRIPNQGHGITLLGVKKVELSDNLIANNLGRGISATNSDSSRVTGNAIIDNQRAGLYVAFTGGDVFRYIGHVDGNRIEGNGTGTGIHLTAASADIVGNQLTDDAGDAITLEQGSTATIRDNNIFDNAGFGLNNLDTSVLVQAPDNWWGDASGPGGVGPGLGDAVSAGVDAGVWRTAAMAVVVAAERDTVAVPAGEADTVSVFVQHWQHSNDVLDLAVSDTQGWMRGAAASATLTGDGTAVEARLPLDVPAGTTDRATSTVTVTATSRADAAQTATETFTLVARSADLADLVIIPDVVEVAPGDTVFFDATALDIFGRRVALTPTWSATGGAIDATGRYIAGEAAGVYAVTATDPASQLAGQAQVYNEVETPTVRDEADASPHAFHLAPNYPNPFNPETTIQYTVAEPGRVRLTVYDVLGREVATLVDEMQGVGAHQVVFDAARLSSGMYIYRLVAEGFSATRTMVVLK